MTAPKLKPIPVGKIKKNPNNPRINFRQEEMEPLLVSISQIGIQVPLAVYEDDDSYILIDGERRFRCANKLGLTTVPALVQERPTPLQNLLLMYNIHALREQWDYLTIASKLGTIEDLMQQETGKRPTEKTLSQRTGLTPGQIRRCRILMSLPNEDIKALESELDKPKSQQVISEDFFIELQRSLKTITRRVPELEKDLKETRKVLIDKYKDRTIPAVTDFRLLANLSRLALKDEDGKRRVSQAVKKLREAPNLGIKDIVTPDLQYEIDEGRILSSSKILLDYLQDITTSDHRPKISPELVKVLEELHLAIPEALENIRA